MIDPYRPLATEEAPSLPSLAEDTVEEIPPTVPARVAVRSPTMHSFQLPETIGGREGNGSARSERASNGAPSSRIANRLLSAAAVAAPTPTARSSSRASSPSVVTPPGRPRLRVLRGQRLHVEFPLADGPNYVGRRDENPIDIDLQDQEPPDRIWTSRRHAVLHLRDGAVEIEDLNSLNGTFVNRCRVSPGQRRVLQINDVVQVGTIQMRLLA